MSSTVTTIAFQVGTLEADGTCVLLAEKYLVHLSPQHDFLDPCISRRNPAKPSIQLFTFCKTPNVSGESAYLHYWS
jgi:hypothetical protein